MTKMMLSNNQYYRFSDGNQDEYVDDMIELMMLTMVMTMVIMMMMMMITTNQLLI